MKITHLSDPDIQKFVFDLSECDARILAHVDSCEACQLKIESYRNLTSLIEDQPEPVLEFNLTTLVINQLESSSSNKSTSNIPIYLLILTSASVTIAIFYLFIETFIDFFRMIKPISIAFILATALIITITSVIDLVRTYNNKVEILNLS